MVFMNNRFVFMITTVWKQDLTTVTDKIHVGNRSLKDIQDK